MITAVKALSDLGFELEILFEEEHDMGLKMEVWVDLLPVFLIPWQL